MAVYLNPRPTCKLYLPDTEAADKHLQMDAKPEEVLILLIS